MSAYPTLTPTSNTSVSVLTSTGSATLVNAGCPFQIYSDPTSDFYSTDFISGAVDQVAFTYYRLGGDVLDLEIVPANVYGAYEESTLEYSYILNQHQAKNTLSSLLGQATGTFDQDGVLKTSQLKTDLSGTHINLKYPKFSFGYAKRVFDGVGADSGVGGSITEYSASFTVTRGLQDYDLQTIVSASDVSGAEYYGKVGNKKILVTKVYYKTPQAMWRFYGFYGGLNVVGNLTNYGQYSDDSTFEVIPVWQNRLQAMNYEDAIWVRNSHYSYELKNNKLRLFPPPSSGSPSKMWIKFSVAGNGWEEDTNRTIGIDGINNVNSLPFSQLPFENINGICKMWIKRYALALTKEILGNIRSKIASVPIPNGEVTLNGPELLSQAKEEKEELRKELKELLDELTYEKLAEKDAKIAESSEKIADQIPMLIFMG